jgi:hypothetical protein
MSFKVTSDGVALVDKNIVYIPIDPENPPKQKVILIDEKYRQPVISSYREGHGWTHYYPLPTFSNGKK